MGSVFQEHCCPYTILIMEAKIVVESVIMAIGSIL